MAAFTSGIKELVSKKKQRYKGEGFNLDLSYITDRLIAMGFPAQNFESLYRNSMDDVKRFLDEKHKDHFKIYNLCSERIYDPAKFYGRVVHFPFDDHHPPKFDDIKPFCDDVTKWLQQNQKNVAVVHCKAGKGRTGVMICCYLLHSKLCESAEESLNYYGRQRTQNEKGVTIPSQRRYINYYERILKTPHLKYQPVYLYLRTLVLDPVPNFNTAPFGGTVDSCYLQFTVNQRSRPRPYVSEWYLIRRGDRQSCLEVDPPLLLREDVKIEFHVKPRVDIIKPKFMQSKKEFHFWLNTFFVDSEFGFSGMAGLAHQVVCGTGNLSPESNWTDASQTSSAPPTANINYVQTQPSPFSSLVTNIPSTCIHGAKEQTEDKPNTCVVMGSRSGVIKQQTTEEKIIMEEQENEDESINTDLHQCQDVGSKGEMAKGSSDAESHCEDCQGCTKNNMQHEGMAPQLQSKVVIENADDQSIRFPQKTENQLQTQSDVSHCTGSSLVFTSSSDTSVQQNVKNEEISSSLQVDGEAQSECCGNNTIPLSSPPVSPNCLSSEGECYGTNAGIERKCSGGSDPGSASVTSGTTIPVSHFHHHNIYSGTSPVDDILDPLQQKDIKSDPQHSRFFCNHSGCNSNANALPERHVSGGFTAPPSRQVSDGTSSSSTTSTTTPSSGSLHAPDTPPVSAISTPHSTSGIAQTHAMTTCSDQPTSSVNLPHTESPCNLVKTAAYSDELLLREQQQQRLQLSVTFADNIPKSPEQSKGGENVEEKSTSGNTTAMSFELNGNSRTRHTSVPQTARSTTTINTHSMHLHHGLDSDGCDVSAVKARQMALEHHALLMNETDKNHTIHGTSTTNHRSSRVQIEGSKLSLRLSKSQIDNAAKSKKKVYQENFSVTLFLVKPKDQSENLKDYTLPFDMVTSRNTNATSQYGTVLNIHTPLANSSSAASVMSTGVLSESDSTFSSTQNHLDPRNVNSKSFLRFGTSNGQKPGGNGVRSKFEQNSSPESSSEDDMGSVEIASTANNDKTTKGILRKSGSSCSSTRVVAVSTKTKANELLEGDTTSSTSSSHQLMTSASEVIHSNTNCSDSADILQMRRVSCDRTAPPTDNADTSITRTNTTTLASVTSDFVVVTLSDVTGSTVSHGNNASNSLREPSDPKPTVTTTPSTSALHHHSHHPISAGPTPANTITVSHSTWI